MKLVLAVLLGLLLAAHVAAEDDDGDDDGHYHVKKSCGHTVYTCVESHEHCWEEKVCEEVEKVPCGKVWCAYPEVCKYDKKKVCNNVTKYKKECGAPKHTCVQDLTKCGDDKCKYDEECTVTKVCELVEKPVKRHSESAYASASANAVSTGGSASAKASAKAVSHGTTYVEPVKICRDKYTCVPKDPCKLVFVQKCVHGDLSEDKAHEGKTFEWMKPWAADQKCGRGYCRDGYKCAKVSQKVCPEAVKCGEKICEPGYKCDLNEVHCKDVPVTTPVCEDVKIGACFKPHDWVDYKPSCKTIWKCKETECGDGYCKAGTACRKDVVPCKSKPKKSGGDDDD